MDRVSSGTRNESTMVREKIAYGLTADCRARLPNKFADVKWRPATTSGFRKDTGAVEEGGGEHGEYVLITEGTSQRGPQLGKDDCVNELGGHASNWTRWPCPFAGGRLLVHSLSLLQQELR